jgi:biotin carboxyl carrier protein
MENEVTAHQAGVVAAVAVAAGEPVTSGQALLVLEAAAGDS